MLRPHSNRKREFAGPGSLSPAWLYLLALLAVALSLVIRLPLDPLLGDRRPYLTLFGGVALAIWWTRWKPAALAAFLGFLAARYFFVRPAFSLDGFFISEAAGYASSVGLIIFFGEAMHRARDRADRKAEDTEIAEQEERRQKEVLRVTLGSIGDAVITTDKNGRITMMNPVAEEVTGWAGKDALGQPLEHVFRILNEKTKQPVESPAVRALREGLIVGLANHTVLVTLDGTERPIDDSAAPIRDARGQIIGCVLVFRDITKRRLAERQLWESSERLRITLASIGDGVIVTDPEGRIVSLNAEAERLSGWSESDAKDQPLSRVFQIVDEDTGQPVESPVANVLRSGAVVGFANHTVLISKTGAMLPIDDSAAPIREPGGPLIGVVLVFRDVSVQRAAHRAQAQIAAIVEYSGDAIFTKDLSGIIRTWNRGAERVFGYREDEILGKPVTILIPPDRLSEEAGILERLRAGAASERLETVRVAKNGRHIPVLLSVSPLRDPDGRIVGASKIIHDISDLVAAQETLHKEKELLRTTLTSIGDGVIVTDLAGRVTFLNREAERLTGWTLADAQGTELENVFRIINEHSRQPVENPVDKVLRLGNVVGLANHTLLLARDGRETPIDDSAAPIRSSDGTQFGVVLVFRDATALRETEERFRVMADAAPVLVWLSGTDKLCTWFNKQWLQFVGRSMEQELGNGWAEGVHEEDLDRCFQTYVKSFDAREPFSMTYRLRRHDGQYRWVLDNGVPRYSREGAFAGYIGSCVDITDQKQAEDFLSDANRRKDEFLATLSHELRNPLAPIRNAIQVLKVKGPADPELIWCREVIHRQANHMSRLLDDLLDVSRISHGHLTLRRARVTLSSIIDNAVELSLTYIRRNQHELKVTLPQEPVYLEADPLRLTQVFSNLLTNSAKYTEPKGNIRLDAEIRERQLVVSVVDNGVGIPKDVLPRIFDIFSRAEPMGLYVQGGLGIGLSLIRGLVHLHGGTIEARSDGPGLGSQFIVRLPLPADDPLSVAPADSPTQKTRSSCRRVLVTDDLRDAADSLAMLLRAMGHEVETAYDGEEALQKAEAFRPDVIMLDIGMPRLDGYAVCRAIRELPWGKGCVLIAMTGWGQEADRQRAIDAGFDHHLVKPADPADILNLLNSLPLVT